jgi:formylglycine-generating enzyme required for sulfatase activity
LTPQEGLAPIGRDPATGLWEFAHLLTGRPPHRDGEGRLVLEDDMALILVLLPGGRFSMGSRPPSPEHPEGSPNVDPKMDEYTRYLSGPVHEVELAPFFMSKFELTRGQWAAFNGWELDGPNPGGAILPQGPFPLLPVESQTWGELKDMLFRMGLDLPTEAQWEYAARAGSATIWWTGDQARSIAGAGNFADSANERKVKLTTGVSYESWLDDGYPALAPVGKFRPNAFGLHDIMGNVSEFCLEPTISYDSPPMPGTGERRGDPKAGRILRGGSWLTNSWFAASARRHQVVEDYRHYQAGVRPSRSIR